MREERMRGERRLARLADSQSRRDLRSMPNIIAVTLSLVVFAAIVNAAFFGIDRRLRRRSGVSST
jgi:hypothetical protein